MNKVQILSDGELDQEDIANLDFVVGAFYDEIEERIFVLEMGTVTIFDTDMQKMHNPIILDIPQVESAMCAALIPGYGPSL